jgi:methionyl-tRNA synthetase
LGHPGAVGGLEGKCLYVWFEAVIGYLSASIEWGKINGEPEAWRTWWKGDQAPRAITFIGKDNIPFHAIIWPAELLGVGTRFDELDGAASRRLRWCCRMMCLPMSL